MDTQQYTEFTRTTAVYPKDLSLCYLILGLASEAGEVAGKYKKFLRGDLNENEPDLDLKIISGVINELSDVMWYVTRLCDELGITLEELMEVNHSKLSKRLENNTIKGDGDNR